MAARQPYAGGAGAMLTSEFEKIALSDTFVGLQFMLFKGRRDLRCLTRPWPCAGAGVRGTEPALEVRFLNFFLNLTTNRLELTSIIMILW